MDAGVIAKEQTYELASSVGLPPAEATYDTAAPEKQHGEALYATASSGDADALCTFEITSIRSSIPTRSLSL